MLFLEWYRLNTQPYSPVAWFHARKKEALPCDRMGETQSHFKLSLQLSESISKATFITTKKNPQKNWLSVGHTHLALLPEVAQVPDGLVLQLRPKERVGLGQDGNQPAEWWRGQRQKEKEGESRKKKNSESQSQPGYVVKKKTSLALCLQLHVKK